MAFGDFNSLRLYDDKRFAFQKTAKQVFATAGHKCLAPLDRKYMRAQISGAQSEGGNE
jgi:hypothetical protein